MSKTFTPNKAFYVGIAHDAFRRGEPGEIVGVFTVEDEQGNASANFLVIYADKFEFLAPINRPERYEILSPNQI